MKMILAWLMMTGCCGVISAQQLSQRVSGDLVRSGQKEDKGYVYYVVDALSNIKRTAEVYPVDGKLGGALQFIAAQDEYEPASLVMYPFRDATEVELTPGPLTGPKGTIPASALDLKVVKIWYQAGNAWHSYFANASERQRIPELLLNDENLVTVDRKNEENYLRIKTPQGKERNLWISAPADAYEPLNTNRNLVKDADTLLPFLLRKGEFKQIWATLHAPADAEGIYSGAIRVRLDGQDAGAIPVEVRVLPFRLPQPKTWYDSNAAFFAGSYNNVVLADYVRDNGGNTENAEKRVRAEYDSFRRHNLLYPLMRSRGPHTKKEDIAFIHRQAELYKECGLGTEALFDGVNGVPSYGDLKKLRDLGPEANLADCLPPASWGDIIREEHAFMQRLFGPKTTIYCFGWDEPSMWIIRAERGPFKFLHDSGLKVISTGNNRHLANAGFNEDFVNYGGRFSKADAEIWHHAHSKITAYADPHTGIENPDFVRRTHGLRPYLNNGDGTLNYMVCGSDWNDFVGTNYNFRAFNWIYPGTFRPIETIQYEAFREAVDDVRYATLLKEYAEKAIAGGKSENVYKGRAALLYLAQLNPEKCDLNTARIEMIRHILELRNLK